jgi:hypothetical protein
MYRAAIVAALVVVACGGSTSTASSSDGNVVGPPPALFIRGVLLPPSPTAEGSCLYTGDPSQPYLSSGRLDVALSTTYAPTLLVGNNGDGYTSSRSAITGFDVTVTDSGGAVVGSFHSDSAAYVDAATGGTPSYAPAAATLLDAATVAVLRGRAVTHVVAHAVVNGKTVTGGAVKSIPFDFPIDLCTGCLVAFPPEVGPAKSGCGTAPQSFVATPCVTGQDQVVDCRLCYAAQPVCRP